MTELANWRHICQAAANASSAEECATIVLESLDAPGMYAYAELMEIPAVGQVC